MKIRHTDQFSDQHLCGVVDPPPYQPNHLQNPVRLPVTTTTDMQPSARPGPSHVLPRGSPCFRDLELMR